MVILLSFRSIRPGTLESCLCVCHQFTVCGMKRGVSKIEGVHWSCTRPGRQNPPDKKKVDGAGVQLFARRSTATFVPDVLVRTNPFNPDADRGLAKSSGKSGKGKGALRACCWCFCRQKPSAFYLKLPRSARSFRTLREPACGRTSRCRAEHSIEREDTLCTATPHLQLVAPLLGH